MVVEYSDGGARRLAGLDVYKIKLLMDDMNFTTVWHKEEQFGILNGIEWTGLIRGLKKTNYNMTANTLTVTQQRNEAISFSFPTQQVVVRLFHQKPNSYSNNWYTFVMVFHTFWAICPKNMIFCIL